MAIIRIFSLLKLRRKIKSALNLSTLKILVGKIKKQMAIQLNFILIKLKTQLHKRQQTPLIFSSMKKMSNLLIVSGYTAKKNAKLTIIC
jgi:hypothetical protein